MKNKGDKMKQTSKSQKIELMQLLAIAQHEISVGCNILAKGHVKDALKILEEVTA